MFSVKKSELINSGCGATVFNEGSGCSTAVERASNDKEVVGSNLAGCSLLTVFGSFSIGDAR